MPLHDSQTVKDRRAGANLLRRIRQDYEAVAGMIEREYQMLELKNIEQNMISVPSGVIVLRDDRIGKTSVARIETFQVCRYPVTRSFYADVLGKPSPSKMTGNHPVESISWLDAAHFCNQLSAIAGLDERYVFSPDGQDATIVIPSNGFRLPSEPEWEFAGRAGTDGPRYGPIDEIAWYRDNSQGSTKPVGAKRPNDWGLHGMLGNVWEWCEDVYDPVVFGTYRIFRGGGWADNERGCLVTNRRRSHPTFAIDDLGFRLARSSS